MSKLQIELDSYVPGLFMVYEEMDGPVYRCAIMSREEIWTKYRNTEHAGYVLSKILELGA